MVQLGFPGPAQASFFLRNGMISRLAFFQVFSVAAGLSPARLFYPFGIDFVAGEATQEVSAGMRTSARQLHDGARSWARICPGHLVHAAQCFHTAWNQAEWAMNSNASSSISVVACLLPRPMLFHQRFLGLAQLVEMAVKRQASDFRIRSAVALLSSASGRRCHPPFVFSRPCRRSFWLRRGLPLLVERHRNRPSSIRVDVTAEDVGQTKNQLSFDDAMVVAKNAIDRAREASRLAAMNFTDAFFNAAWQISISPSRVTQIRPYPFHAMYMRTGSGGATDIAFQRRQSAARLLQQRFGRHRCLPGAGHRIGPPSRRRVIPHVVESCG